MAAGQRAQPAGRGFPESERAFIGRDLVRFPDMPTPDARSNVFDAWGFECLWQMFILTLS